MPVNHHEVMIISSSIIPSSPRPRIELKQLINFEFQSFSHSLHHIQIGKNQKFGKFISSCQTMEIELLVLETEFHCQYPIFLHGHNCDCQFLKN